MARYSIDGQVLTDIADGIREKDVPKVLVGDYDWDWSYTKTGYNWYYNLTIPNATTIKLINVNAMEDGRDFFTPGRAGSFVIAPYRISKAYDYFDKPSDALYYSPASERPPQELVFETDTIGFSVDSAGTGMVTYTISAHVIAYDADGNIIGGRTYRDAPKAGITPEEMAEGISDLPSVPVEVFNLTGECINRFAGGNQDWLINLYGDRILTNNITNASGMFELSNVKSIPFELNFNSSSGHNLSSLFDSCGALTEIPKINNARPSNTTNLFYGCRNLRYLPEDLETWFDWSGVDTTTSSSGAYRGRNTFSSCYSLRSVPMGFLNHNNPYATSNSYNLFYGLFSGCYSLDEIVGLPLARVGEKAWTSNMFSSTFNSCNRLKNMTFATNEDGSPIVANWKSQTIDLSSYVGYGTNSGVFTIYNSGIKTSHCLVSICPQH